MQSHLATASEIDVRAIMRRIRDQIRGTDPEQEWVRAGRRALPAGLLSSVDRLRASTAHLRSAVAQIGEVPPAPPTLRGRVGALVVRALQRGLFWLIPSIRNSQFQIVDALDLHLAATSDILQVLQQTHIEIARLSAETAAHREPS